MIALMLFTFDSLAVFFDLRRRQVQKVGYLHELGVAVLFGRQAVVLGRVLHKALTHGERHRVLLEHGRRRPHVIPVLVHRHAMVTRLLVIFFTRSLFYFLFPIIFFN